MDGTLPGGAFVSGEASVGSVGDASAVGMFSVRAANKPFEPCFSDVMHALEDALRTLGKWSPYGRPIMFGVSPTNEISDDVVVYEAEQLVHPCWHIARKNVVWTFSETIAQGLRERGTKRVVPCPIGYVPSMTSIQTVSGEASISSEDIDVLFYGSMNDRRRPVIDALRASGLRFEYPPVAFGAERDALIARSKVVLNLHLYDSSAFEIFRVSHLLANRKAVVSENGGIDPALEDFAFKSTSLVSFDKIVEECIRLVRDDVARQALADRGFEALRQVDFVETVRRALAETEGLS